MRNCTDCGKDVMNEDYMVFDNIWWQATKGEWPRFLCINCLERRLGRKLNWYDFDWNLPINFWPDNRSNLLVNRMITK